MASVSSSSSSPPPPSQRQPQPHSSSSSPSPAASSDEERKAAASPAPSDDDDDDGKCRPDDDGSPMFESPASSQEDLCEVPELDRLELVGCTACGETFESDDDLLQHHTKEPSCSSSEASCTADADLSDLDNVTNDSGIIIGEAKDTVGSSVQTKAPSSPGGHATPREVSGKPTKRLHDGAVSGSGRSRTGDDGGAESSPIHLADPGTQCRQDA